MDLLKETDRDGLYIRHAVDEAPDNKGIDFHIHDRCFAMGLHHCQAARQGERASARRHER